MHFLCSVSDINPNLRTPPEDFSAVEKAKLSTQGLTIAVKDVNSPSSLFHQSRDTTSDDLVEVAETLAKSYGIYLEFNRAKTGSKKDWMYNREMILLLVRLYPSQVTMTLGYPLATM